MADYGIKISKAGYDILTASFKFMSFISATWKVFMTGTATLTGSAENNYPTLEISHNLGYKPTHFVFFEGIAAGQYPTTNEAFWSDQITQNCTVDSSKLYMAVGYLAAGVSLDLRYYIFVDQGA